MKKAEKIAALVEEVGAGADALDPCYHGYFVCFNEQRYYDAHDVLEHLWLQTSGADHLYYKGLIQIAGAFVHLQKHHLRPHHPKDASRLQPAVRLFRLGIKNLEPYRPRHLRLDVNALCELCAQRVAEILASDFQQNPWDPARAPKLFLSS